MPSAWAPRCTVRNSSSPAFVSGFVALSFHGLQQKRPWWDCKGMKAAASARSGASAALAGRVAAALILVASVATALSATTAEAAGERPAQGVATVVLIVRA